MYTQNKTQKKTISQLHFFHWCCVLVTCWHKRALPVAHTHTLVQLSSFQFPFFLFSPVFMPGMFSHLMDSPYTCKILPYFLSVGRTFWRSCIDVKKPFCYTCCHSSDSVMTTHRFYLPQDKKQKFNNLQLQIGINETEENVKTARGWWSTAEFLFDPLEWIWKKNSGGGTARVRSRQVQSTLSLPMLACDT